MIKKIVIGIVIIAVIVLLVGSRASASPQLQSLWNQVPQSVKDYISKTISTSKEEIINRQVKVVSEESVVIDVVDAVSPSVVTVGIVREKPIIEYEALDPFGFFRQPRQRGTEKEESDIGSGFIISKDGLVVTNKHVVSDTASTYKIITGDNTTYDVKNIYRDPANDIAILKIDATDLKPVETGDSDKLKVGQLVVALGTPLGEFRGSVTKGILSGIGRGITTGSPFEGVAERIDNVIQTDAAINPGNSGGPLVNSSSQVIGVNTAVASGAENIGFALPINIVKDAIKNFKDTGSFERPFLGVSYQMISQKQALMNDVPEGAYVIQVTPDSAAQKAGLQEGDIITKIDGKRLRTDDKETMAEIIGKKKKGDTISITYFRDGEEKEIQVTLGEYRGTE